MLKGETTIELTNVHTGKKEEIKSENMFTNALQNIVERGPKLGLDLFHWHLFGDLFPLPTRLLGGILLFDSTLEERLDNITPLSLDDGVECIGYASNDVNPDSDLKRGSFNIVESGVLDDGYRFVWDFGTSQANGRIESVSLTTETGGKYGTDPSPSQALFMYGGMYDHNDGNVIAARLLSSTNGKETVRFNIKSVEGENTAMDIQNVSGKNIFSFNPDSLHFEMGHTEIVDGNITLFLYDAYINASQIRLNDTPTLIEKIKNCRSCVICENNTTFGSNGHIEAVRPIDEDDFCYVVGDANANTVAIAKIKVSTMELVYCKNASISPNKITLDSSYSMPKVIKNNHLYLCGYDSKSSILKINIENMSEMTVLKPDPSLGIPDSASVTYDCFKPIIQGKRAFFTEAILNGDSILPAGIKFHRDTSYYGVDSGGIIGGSLAWSNIGDSGFLVSIVANAMMTINNLPTPVVKTADKTMKITYIVRDVDESV